MGDNFSLIKSLVDAIKQNEDSDEENPFFSYVVDDNGTVNRDGLITFVQEWADKNDDQSKYSKLIEGIEHDDGLFKELLDCILYDPESDDSTIPSGAVITNFWDFFGIAIRKCVGSKAVQMDKKEFLKAYPVDSQRQKEAKETCVKAYNWNPNAFTKEEVPELYKRFMPKIRSSNRNIRTTKKHISIAKAKAKKLMMDHSRDRFELGESTVFSGKTNLIPKQFADYTKQANRIV